MVPTQYRWRLHRHFSSIALSKPAIVTCPGSAESGSPFLIYRNYDRVIEKSIEIYSFENGKLRLDKPAFDLQIHEGGNVTASQPSHPWGDLSKRLLMDFKERVQPRGTLERRSAEVWEHFRSLSTRVKFSPGPMENWLTQETPTARPASHTFEQALDWLKNELTKYDLAFRVITPGQSTR